jgi:hypothetical protein
MEKIKTAYWITIGVIAFIFDAVVALTVLLVVAGTQ